MNALVLSLYHSLCALCVLISALAWTLISPESGSKVNQKTWRRRWRWLPLYEVPKSRATLVKTTTVVK